MVKLTNQIARKNSNLLMQRAIQRRNAIYSSSLISARQTTQRFVPRDPLFSSSKPKIEIDRPLICKPKKNI